MINRWRERERKREIERERKREGDKYNSSLLQNVRMEPLVTTVSNIVVVTV